MSFLSRTFLGLSGRCKSSVYFRQACKIFSGGPDNGPAMVGINGWQRGPWPGD